jgi:hypothetical protein
MVGVVIVSAVSVKVARAASWHYSSAVLHRRLPVTSASQDGAPWRHEPRETEEDAAAGPLLLPSTHRCRICGTLALLRSCAHAHCVRPPRGPLAVGPADRPRPSNHLSRIGNLSGWTMRKVDSSRRFGTKSGESSASSTRETGRKVAIPSAISSSGYRRGYSIHCE